MRLSKLAIGPWIAGPAALMAAVAFTTLSASQPAQAEGCLSFQATTVVQTDAAGQMSTTQDLILTSGDSTLADDGTTTVPLGLVTALMQNGVFGPDAITDDAPTIQLTNVTDTGLLTGDPAARLFYTAGAPDLLGGEALIDPGVLIAEMIEKALTDSAAAGVFVIDLSYGDLNDGLPGDLMFGADAEIVNAMLDGTFQPLKQFQVQAN